LDLVVVGGPAGCEFGATDIVAERGDDGVARIKDLTAVPADHAHGTACAIRKASAARPKVGTRNAWLMVSLPLAAGNAYGSRMPPTAGIRGQRRVPVPGLDWLPQGIRHFLRHLR
jgi:hypothetical protein